MLGFEIYGETRSDPRVGAPAQLLRICLNWGQREIARMGGKIELAAATRSLYPYFSRPTRRRGSNSGCGRWGDRSQPLVGKPRPYGAPTRSIQDPLQVRVIEIASSRSPHLVAPARLSFAPRKTPALRLAEIGSESRSGPNPARPDRITRPRPMRLTRLLNTPSGPRFALGPGSAWANSNGAAVRTARPSVWVAIIEIGLIQEYVEKIYKDLAASSRAVG